MPNHYEFKVDYRMSGSESWRRGPMKSPLLFVEATPAEVTKRRLRRAQTLTEKVGVAPIAG